MLDPFDAYEKLGDTAVAEADPFDAYEPLPNAAPSGTPGGPGPSYSPTAPVNTMPPVADPAISMPPPAFNPYAAQPQYAPPAVGAIPQAPAFDPAMNRGVLPLPPNGVPAVPNRDIVGYAEEPDHAAIERDRFLGLKAKRIAKEKADVPPMLIDVNEESNAAILQKIKKGRDDMEARRAWRDEFARQATAEVQQGVDPYLADKHVTERWMKEKGKTWKEIQDMTSWSSTGSYEPEYEARELRKGLKEPQQYPAIAIAEDEDRPEFAPAKGKARTWTPAGDYRPVDPKDLDEAVKRLGDQVRPWREYQQLLGPSTVGQRQTEDDMARLIRGGGATAILKKQQEWFANPANRGKPYPGEDVVITGADGKVYVRNRLARAILGEATSKNQSDAPFAPASLIGDGEERKFWVNKLKDSVKGQLELPAGEGSASAAARGTERIGGGATSFAGMAVQSAGDFLENLTTGGEGRPRKIIDQGNLVDNPNAMNPVQRAGAATEKAGGKVMDDATSRFPKSDSANQRYSASWLIEGAAESVPYTLAAIGTTLVAGPEAGVAVGTALAFAGDGGEVARDVQSDLARKGYSEKDARAIGVGMGVLAGSVSAALEKVELSSILGHAATAAEKAAIKQGAMRYAVEIMGRMGRNAPINMLKEGGTEWLQSIATQSVRQAATGVPVDFGQAFDEGLLGAASGAAFGATELHGEIKGAVQASREAGAEQVAADTANAQSDFRKYNRAFEESKAKATEPAPGPKAAPASPGTGGARTAIVDQDGQELARGEIEQANGGFAVVKLDNGNRVRVKHEQLRPEASKAEEVAPPPVERQAETPAAVQPTESPAPAAPRTVPTEAELIARTNAILGQDEAPTQRTEASAPAPALPPQAAPSPAPQPQASDTPAAAQPDAEIPPATESTAGALPAQRPSPPAKWGKGSPVTRMDAKGERHIGTFWGDAGGKKVMVVDRGKTVPVDRSAVEVPIGDDVGAQVGGSVQVQGMEGDGPYRVDAVEPNGRLKVMSASGRFMDVDPHRIAPDKAAKGAEVAQPPVAQPQAAAGLPTAAIPPSPEGTRKYSSDAHVEDFLSDLWSRWDEVPARDRAAANMIRRQFDETIDDQQKPVIDDMAASGNKVAQRAVEMMKDAGLYWEPAPPPPSTVDRNGVRQVGPEPSSAQPPSPPTTPAKEPWEKSTVDIYTALVKMFGDEQRLLGWIRGGGINLRDLPPQAVSNGRRLGLFVSDNSGVGRLVDTESGAGLLGGRDDLPTQIKESAMAGRGELSRTQASGVDTARQGVRFAPASDAVQEGGTVPPVEGSTTGLSRKSSSDRAAQKRLRGGGPQAEAQRRPESPSQRGESAQQRREPWQMTREEFGRQGGDISYSSEDEGSHRAAVEGAIARGVKVPPEVLKGYPWLEDLTEDEGDYEGYDQPKKEVVLPDSLDTHSARHAHINAHREAVGKPGLESTVRRGWFEAQQTARSMGIPGRAVQIAAAVLANPRPLTDIEGAGMVEAAVALQNQFDRLGEEIDAAKGDPIEVAFKIAEQARVEQDYSAIEEALYRSGSERGRALNQQKMTLNRSMELVSVLSRARIAKGSELTAQERAKFTEMVEKLKTSEAKVAELQAKISELAAKKGMEDGSRRFRGRTPESKTADRAARASRIEELLKAGCN